eukprot:tig00001164_g7416.t1
MEATACWYVRACTYRRVFKAKSNRNRQPSRRKWKEIRYEARDHSAAPPKRSRPAGSPPKLEPGQDTGVGVPRALGTAFSVLEFTFGRASDGVRGRTAFSVVPAAWITAEAVPEEDSDGDPPPLEGSDDEWEPVGTRSRTAPSRAQPHGDPPPREDESIDGESDGVHANGDDIDAGVDGVDGVHVDGEDEIVRNWDGREGGEAVAKPSILKRVPLRAPPGGGFLGP